jgi:hypothetical protein
MQSYIRRWYSNSKCIFLIKDYEDQLKCRWSEGNEVDLKGLHGHLMLICAVQTQERKTHSSFTFWGWWCCMDWEDVGQDIFCNAHQRLDYAYSISKRELSSLLCRMCMSHHAPYFIYRSYRTASPLDYDTFLTLILSSDSSSSNSESNSNISNL